MKVFGTYTALVTPFRKDKSIDFDSYGKLIDFQIENGIEGIVPVGSTGEGATLRHEEKLECFRFAVDRVRKRCAVIAGTGSNDTQATIELTIQAKEIGVDGVLLVTPFYNKPTTAGLLAHFKAILDAVEIPIIIYNVPGRTASNVPAEVQIQIAELSPHIIATKEASANLEQMMVIMRNAPSHFSLLAGDDSLALPAIASGARGVVSVLSNYAPRQFGNLVRAALTNDFATARELQNTLLPCMTANFCETNPQPVKYILSKLGMIENVLRLPLVPVEPESEKLLDRVMVESGIG